MPTAGKNVEKKIETALISVLGEAAYVVTNSIPVRAKHSSNSAAPQMIIVNVQPLESYAGFSSVYQVPVEIMAVTDEDNDPTLSKLDSMYQAALGVVQTKTAAEITTAMGTSPGIAVGGVIIGAGGEETPNANDFNTRSLNITVFCHNA